MKLIYTLMLACLCQFAGAQKMTIDGKVLDAKNGEPIIGATVSLLQATDSVSVAGEITDIDGNFSIKDIRRRDFLLEISYLGYERLTRLINAEFDVDLGVINLTEASEILDEVVVEAEAVTATQRGDTISYNASAFTTLDDATSGDLIAKMPGIIIQDGQVQADGEAVQMVLVDGKEFFGGDVNTALQSLPAEIIKNIEIYDRKSDKAEMTGFDDGNEQKTINIVTKASKKIGQFGKMTAGYGTDDTYQAGASVNFFNDDQRWTVTGLSNNINITDFTADANSQGDARTQDGIITTNSIGLQYSNNFGKKLEVSGSYGYGDRNNEADGRLFRDYLLPSQDDQIYQEFNRTVQNNIDHRANVRLEYQINQKNKLILLPRISIKNDINDNRFLGTMLIDDDAINQTTNASQSNNFDTDFGSTLLFNHRFDKKGRSLTLNGGLQYHNNADEATRQAENIFFFDNFTEVEDLDQLIELTREGFDVEFGTSYTEPVGKNGKIELEYEFRNRKNDSERLNYDLEDELIGGSFVQVLDTSLSNVFDNVYNTNEAELGYQYKTKTMSIQAEIQYQRADLQNAQVFPAETNLSRTFYSVLPTFRMDYKFSKNSNLEFNYYTWTREPAVSQLQEVIDNSNPLQLRVGNPNLGQEFNNRIRARYRLRNADKETSFYVGMDASLVNNAITNTTIIAEEAFAVNENITLQQGGQLIRPQNVDGNWNVRSFVSYGRPIKVIKSNFNAWTGAGYRQLPGVINGQNSFTHSSSVRMGLNLSSNISDKIDFNISTRTSYSIVNNSLRPQLNNNFFQQRTSISFKAILWKGITFRTDARHQFFGGLSDDVDNSYFLINGSIGKRIFKDQSGEISLRVYDLLQQNNNIDREVGEIFIEDSERTVLQRYFMLSFTYNLRHFSGGYNVGDFDTSGGSNNSDRRGRGGRGRGRGRG